MIIVDHFRALFYDVFLSKEIEVSLISFEIKLAELH